jgi:quercetin dioxygenase-like cupin family protein
MGVNDSGVVSWFQEYPFEQDGVVETSLLRLGTLPFDISRWDVRPGRRNDVDVHRSTEVRLVTGGTGMLTVDGQDSRIGVGDAGVLRSCVPHQPFNDGTEPCRAFSVYVQCLLVGPRALVRSGRRLGGC